MLILCLFSLLAYSRNRSKKFCRHYSEPKPLFRKMRFLMVCLFALGAGLLASKPHHEYPVVTEFHFHTLQGHLKIQDLIGFDVIGEKKPGQDDGVTGHQLDTVESYLKALFVAKVFIREEHENRIVFKEIPKNNPDQTPIYLYQYFPHRNTKVMTKEEVERAYAEKDEVQKRGKWWYPDAPKLVVTSSGVDKPHYGTLEGNAKIVVDHKQKVKTS
ncbi:hypothetical protein DdX_18515 [Ditylenchus destructor]|uniref:Uncharacterized protein n=1 Tax=Ditylenchus destructor TaxID=166010 RepID=A0AAD4QY31_9BILA|nr:hypothetical protein DdX_18515 [Ditylenchus destructor]